MCGICQLTGNAITGQSIGYFDGSSWTLLTGSQDLVQNAYRVRWLNGLWFVVGNNNGVGVITYTSDITNVSSFTTVTIPKYRNVTDIA